MQTSLDEAQLKALFKAVLLEVMEERQDLFREAVQETLEDYCIIAGHQRRPDF